MEERLAPNSMKSKEKEEPKTSKVTTGKVVSKEKSTARKFKDLFFKEDFKNVRTYLITDILIPKLQDALVDSFSKTIQMLVYGSVRAPQKGGSSIASYNSYNSMYKPKAIDTSRRAPTCNDLLFETEADANMVIDELMEIVDKFGKATIGDFYDAAGVTGNGYTDRYYGWTDLRGTYVHGVRDGYLIEMPRPVAVSDR